MYIAVKPDVHYNYVKPEIQCLMLSKNELIFHTNLSVNCLIFDPAVILNMQMGLHQICLNMSSKFEGVNKLKIIYVCFILETIYFGQPF